MDKIQYGGVDSDVLTWEHVQNKPTTFSASLSGNLLTAVPANAIFTDTTYTLASLGYTGATNANYITNNNQLTNGEGYIKSYVNTTYSAGDGLDLSGTTFSLEQASTTNKGGVTLSTSTSSTSTSLAATASAVKSAYDRAASYAPSKTGSGASGTWSINTTGTVNGYTVSKSVPSNAVFTDTNTQRAITNSVSTTSSTTCASATAVKSAYDRAASYAPSKAGSGASGTWSIAITGKAGQVTVNTSSSSSWYGLVWNSGNTLYTETGQLEVQPSTGALRSDSTITGRYTSDIRTKKDIVPIANATEKLATLGGYEYEYINPESGFEGKQYGLIAQEVQAVISELVEEDATGTLRIKTGGLELIGLLVQGFNEMSDRVKKLEDDK